MRTYEKFNNSAFGCWINSPTGRLFRLSAGIIFLMLGIIYLDTLPGIASLIWSIFPLSAGVFNICWVSLVLGGPLMGYKIVEQQKKK